MKKLLIILMTIVIFMVSCSIKVTVENELPNTIFVEMETYEDENSESHEIESADSVDVKHTAGKNNKNKEFILYWSAEAGGSNVTWVTNAGGYHLGGFTPLLSAKDGSIVTITYVGTETDIARDTWMIE